MRHINELNILSYFNAVILHDDNAYIALYTKQGQEFAQTVNCWYGLYTTTLFLIDTNNFYMKGWFFIYTTL